MDDQYKLTPEDLALMMALPGLNDQDQLIQHQLAQAEALRNPQHRESYGAGAGIGNGLSAAIGGIASGIRSKQLMDQLKQIAGQKQAAREHYGNSVFGGLTTGGNPGQMQPPQMIQGEDQIPQFLRRPKLGEEDQGFQLPDFGGY